MENSHLWVSTLLNSKTKENKTMETENITQPINWPCDPKADGQRKFTVPDGNYALTAWEVSVSKSKNGDPLMNVKFGINGHIYKCGEYFGRNGKQVMAYSVNVYEIKIFSRRQTLGGEIKIIKIRSFKCCSFHHRIFLWVFYSFFCFRNIGFHECSFRDCQFLEYRSIFVANIYHIRTVGISL